MLKISIFATNCVTLSLFSALSVFQPNSSPSGYLDLVFYLSSRQFNECYGTKMTLFHCSLMSKHLISYPINIAFISQYKNRLHLVEILKQDAHWENKNILLAYRWLPSVIRYKCDASCQSIVWYTHRSMECKLCNTVQAFLSEWCKIRPVLYV